MSSMSFEASIVLDIMIQMPVHGDYLFKGKLETRGD